MTDIVTAPLRSSPLVTDILPITNADGSLDWEKISLLVLKQTMGGIMPALVRPDNALFGWTNQGGATVTVNDDGSISLFAPLSATANYRLRTMPIPAAPYTATIGFIASLGWSVDFQMCGLVLQDSVSGKFVTLSIDSESTFHGFLSARMTNPTTFSANVGTKAFVGGNNPIFFRVHDDGVNRIFSVSTDGRNFITFLTEANTTFCTPDKIGFCVNEQTNALAASINVIHWELN